MPRSATAALSRRHFLGMAGAAGVATATGALAACGSNTGRGGAGDAIQQWYHAYDENGVQQAANRFASEYTKHKVTVQWNVGDYDSILAKALLNGTVPDVYEAELRIDRVRQNQAVAMDDVIAPAKDDFLPTVLAAHTVDGTVYSIPQAVDTQVLYYRKSALAQAGVRPPQTVDELIDAARALTRDGRKGIFLGNDGGVSVMLGPLLWSAGQDFLVEDGGRYRAGFDRGAATALGKLHELHTSGSLLTQAKKDWSEPDAFTSGQVALQWTGLWAMPKVTGTLKDDFGVLPWPKLDDSGAPSVPVGAFGSTVNGRSTKIADSKDFVRWLWIDQADKQAEFDTGYGFHIPARRSLIDRAGKLTVGPAADAVGYVQQHSHLVGGPVWTNTMNTAYTDGLTRIARDGADLVGQIDRILDTVNDELKRLFG